jgi:hypothetical protein
MGLDYKHFHAIPAKGLGQRMPLALGAFCTDPLPETQDVSGVWIGAALYREEERISHPVDSDVCARGLSPEIP